MDQNVVSVRVAQSSFKRFQSGNFNVKDKPRSGRPVTEKVDGILEKVQDQHISSYDIVEKLGIEHKNLNSIEKARHPKKPDTWIPHELTERNLMNCVLICDSLLKCNETEPFLKRLITSDEKWITYDKNVQKRSFNELLPPGKTIN
ncbi:Histone-lysine N-methyltransferase SETMAR [Eumeta japonica]|uniref:Histone-lysine N-methyltransferase SETMAR n=1 Tax=Eumeta variegata TaxID=151549 RepID=A0A4C1SNB1_EUMVA|nr:Histone-lysine N-methyltransferase SETMAR [Eumeta japonica]